MILANVIYPTFTTYPYVLWIVLPLGLFIFAVEFGAALFILKNDEKKGKIAWVIALANMCSSAVGVAAGTLLSVILGEANNLVGESAGLFLFLSYFVAFILSVLIEALVLGKFIKREPWKLSFLLNCISYSGFVAIWLYG